MPVLPARTTPPLSLPRFELVFPDDALAALCLRYPDGYAGLVTVGAKEVPVIVRPWAAEALKKAVCTTALLAVRRLGEVAFNVAEITYEYGPDRGKAAFRQAIAEGW
jgi:hypothetical protein